MVLDPCKHLETLEIDLGVLTLLLLTLLLVQTLLMHDCCCYK